MLDKAVDVLSERVVKPLEVYLIPKEDGRFHLSSTPEALAAIEAESTDRLRQSVEWLSNRQSRALAWVGRGIRSLHDYYVKLEEKIDPVERILKAMASTNHYVVYTSEECAFRRAINRQRWKHVFWFSIDFIITGVVLVFTPFLAPIPGPNLFFYYPFLRLLSHYRAIQGALCAMNSGDIQFRRLTG